MALGRHQYYTARDQYLGTLASSNTTVTSRRSVLRRYYDFRQTDEPAKTGQVAFKSSKIGQKQDAIDVSPAHGELIKSLTRLWR